VGNSDAVVRPLTLRLLNAGVPSAFVSDCNDSRNSNSVRFVIETTPRVLV